MVVPEAGVWRCSVKLLKFSENYLKNNHDRVQCFWMRQITHHQKSFSLIFRGAPARAPPALSYLGIVFKFTL